VAYSRVNFALKEGRRTGHILRRKCLLKHTLLKEISKGKKTKKKI